jgi:NitT/TauT family transport system substrate-binding protein
MIKSKYWYIIWPIPLVAVLAGGAAFAQGSSGKTAEQLSVRLSWTPGGYDAPFFLAVDKGWFTQRGLDVIVLDGNGSSITVQTVGAGQFDVGYTNLAVMALARDKGVKVKAIADILRRSDLGVVFPTGSDIKTAQDLRGKKIVYTPASFETPFLPHYFKTIGVSQREVTLVAVDAAVKFSTYASGNADAVITAAPYFIPFLANMRPSKYILFSDAGITLPGFGLIASDATIRQRPTALSAFVAVIAEAWNYILNGHEEEAVESMIKQRPQAKLNSTVLLDVINAYRPFFETPATRSKPIGWQADSDWVEALKIMKDAGAITSGAPAADYYTNEFAPVP